MVSSNAIDSIRWPKEKLRNLALKIGSGATPRGGKQSYKETGTTLIRSQNVFDDGFVYTGLVYIDENQSKKLNNVIVYEKDVLLNITGAAVARCCMVPSNILPARVNQHVLIIRPKEEVLNPAFLWYTLICPRYKIGLLNIAQGGATREALTKEMIENFEISLPPLTIQTIIVSILSAFDYLIVNNCRRIQLLEEMARAIYREWFVHFRFPGHEEVELVDSELGDIPKGWRIAPFTEMADILSGGTPRTKNPNLWNGEIPFFTPRDIKGGIYILDTERHITKLGLDSCRSENFPKDTVFITARGTVGRVVMPAVSMAMSQTSYALRGRNKIGQFFVFYRTLECVEQLKKMTHGAVFDTIITDTFKSLKISLPPIAIIQSFCEIISPFQDQILNQMKQNYVLQSIRESLLPKLVFGQIDVSDLKIEIPADNHQTSKYSDQSTLDQWLDRDSKES